MHFNVHNYWDFFKPEFDQSRKKFKLRRLADKGKRGPEIREIPGSPKYIVFKCHAV